jgi:hypothetical protein
MWKGMLLLLLLLLPPSSPQWEVVQLLLSHQSVMVWRSCMKSSVEEIDANMPDR